MSMKLELKIPEELFELACKEWEKNWQSDKVVIKHFLSKETWRIQDESIKIKTNMGLQMNADVNIGKAQAITILMGVIEAPWGVNNLNAIEELPPFISTWAYNEINKFNTIELKKKISSDSLQEEQ